MRANAKTGGFMVYPVRPCARGRSAVSIHKAPPEEDPPLMATKTIKPSPMQDKLMRLATDRTKSLAEHAGEVPHALICARETWERVRRELEQRRLKT